MGELNIQIKLLTGNSPILFVWWNKELDVTEGCLIACPCQNLGLSENLTSQKRKGRKVVDTISNNKAVTLGEALEKAEIVTIPIGTESKHHENVGRVSENKTSGITSEYRPSKYMVRSVEQHILKEKDQTGRTTTTSRSNEKDETECGRWSVERNNEQKEGNAQFCHHDLVNVKMDVAKESSSGVLASGEHKKDDEGSLSLELTQAASDSQSQKFSDTLNVSTNINGNERVDENCASIEVQQLTKHNLDEIERNILDVSVNEFDKGVFQIDRNSERIDCDMVGSPCPADKIHNEANSAAGINHQESLIQEPTEERKEVHVHVVDTTDNTDSVQTRFIDVGGISSDAVVVVSDSKDISDVESLFRALKGIIEQDIQQGECTESNDVAEPDASSLTDGELPVNTSAFLNYEEYRNEIYLKKLHQKPKTRCAETAICEVCGAIVNTRTIKQHMTAFHSTEQRERKFSCEICSKSFFRAENRDRHRRLHSKPSFYCQHCERSFMQAYQLKAHEKTHFGYRPPPRLRRPGQSTQNECHKQVECRKCGIGVKKKDLKRHLEIAHGVEEPSLECSQCNKRFYSTSNLKIHEMTHSELTYKCSYCDKTFTQNKVRLRHERSHFGSSIMQGKRRFKCGYCDKTYSRQTDRLRHEMTHIDSTIDASHGRGDKEQTSVLIDCQVCGKTLKQQSLRNHMASHDQKIWTCNICEKTFTYSYRYQHAKLHQGKKPHVCSHCPARFFSKSALVVHLRKHTKDRPIPCRYCDRTFSRYGTRNTHERLHTGERPYQCDLCQKGWRDRPTYMQHMNRHHPGLPLMKWRKSNPQSS